MKLKPLPELFFCFPTELMRNLAEGENEAIFLYSLNLFILLGKSILTYVSRSLYIARNA